MSKVNIYEAKTRLSQLVEEAAAGKDVVIAR
jgi:antitoxin (DNA-binding transcriptional repressor) of toxin-antitoxin stability system